MQMAASAMTETVMPPEILANLKVTFSVRAVVCANSLPQPDFVAPFVLAVTHTSSPADASGKVFELGAGFIAEIRWERSKGAVFKTDASFTPSAVKQKWAEVTDFANPD